MQNNKNILSQDFFNREAPVVASELLGKFLVRKINRKEIACMITEVEAYDGERDLACHASKGRTARTEVMYGESGHWYVYLCYGMYFMLNIVTGKRDYPAAVLIRGIVHDGKHLNGPGRVTKQLAIDKKLNTKSAAKESGLWIEDCGIVVPKKYIKRTPRIGVAYAGKWAEKPWRFVFQS